MDQESGDTLELWSYVIERKEKLVPALVAAPPTGSTAYLPFFVKTYGFTIMHTVLKRPVALPDWLARVDIEGQALTVTTGAGVPFYIGPSGGPFPTRFAYAARENPWCWLYISGPPLEDLRAKEQWEKLEETAALGGLVAARVRIELAPVRL